MPSDSLQDVSKAHAGGLKLTAETPEHDDDRASRLRIEETDADARRRREGFLFYVAVLVNVSLYVAGGYIFFTTTDDSVRQWSITVISSLVLGNVGFFAGKMTRK